MAGVFVLTSALSSRLHPTHQCIGRVAPGPRSVAVEVRAGAATKGLPRYLNRWHFPSIFKAVERRGASRTQASLRDGSGAGSSGASPAGPSRSPVKPASALSASSRADSTANDIGFATNSTSSAQSKVRG